MTTKGEMQLLWANGMSIPDLMDMHAHELAEKLRDELDCETCSCVAADLIDPKTVVVLDR